MEKCSKTTTEETEFNTVPVQVQNKDIPLLSDVLCIMQDVRGIEMRREWQKDRMYNITQHLSGMPGGSGGPKGLDDSFSKLSELETEHEQRCKDYTRQLKRAERILNSIESQSMRTFVMMKYVMDTPDTEIRRELNMSRRGFERARKCIESAPNMSLVKWKERYILAED
jgi:hypothetical protein